MVLDLLVNLQAVLFGHHEVEDDKLERLDFPSL